MAGSVHSLLHRQIARVSRRLFLQTFLNALVWCWVGALALAAGCFLGQLYLLRAPLDGRSWAIAGGLLGAGAVAAVVVAIIRAPSRLAAALLLDEKFGLKERVTTSLTLPRAMEDSPAGRALLDDVGGRIGKLDVATRFPVRLSWPAVLVPACAAALLAGAFFLEPLKAPATTTTTDDSKQPVANADEVQQKLEKLAKKPTEQKPAEQADKSKELQQIEAELEKIVNKPHTTKDDIRQRSSEISDLEADMKKREKELADKAQALKEQLKQIDRMSKDGNKDGPARDMEKALADGDFKKAQEEAEKLSKKLEKNELSKEDQEKLNKQLQDLKDKLDRMAKQQDEVDKLKELARKGQLDQEQLQRELEQLKKNSDNLKDLQDVANKLQQCKECMAKGDGAKAAKALKQAADKLKDLEGEDKEIEELSEKLQELQDCKQCMGKCCNDNPVPASGRRPEDKSGDFKSRPNQQRVDFDAKGRKEITDLVPGRAFQKKSSSEIAGEVEQASQEAPEAIERQRLPRAASEMTKGYYENLRQEAEKDKKPASK